MTSVRDSIAFPVTLFFHFLLEYNIPLIMDENIFRFWKYKIESIGILVTVIRYVIIFFFFAITFLNILKFHYPRFRIDFSIA